MATTTVDGIPKSRLDDVVQALQEALRDDGLRREPVRAVQAKIWHTIPQVASNLTELRAQETALETEILLRISELIYRFHAPALDATLARAGIRSDDRVHAGSSLQTTTEKLDVDLLHLDAKERLYLILQKMGWLQIFFKRYPQHFYENSFRFVEHIPNKKLRLKVRVVGLGIAGSMALSGLAKEGIQAVGYEKRSQQGPRSVTSRYQNASWRAYDIARELVDEKAYQQFLENRQRMHVTFDDGTTEVRSSDRVQIILGSAIQATLDSAKRFGAKIQFECKDSDYLDAPDGKCDMMALFCGAHTAYLAPGLKDALNIYEWPGLDSSCRMWLRLKESEHTDSFCTRWGEVGAEEWDYTIHSARHDKQDVQRILDNLGTDDESTASRYQATLEKILSHDAKVKKQPPPTAEQVYEHYQKQCEQVKKVLAQTGRFDYIFTNAPINSHNLKKREEADSVVLDGGYTVEVKLASRSSVQDNYALLNNFKTDLLVCGGDACVSPNPQAAYGATLACEAAGNFVTLAVATGHLNAIQDNLPDEDVSELKQLLARHYEARSKSENYFQWIQTLICNLYSLPKFK